MIAFVYRTALANPPAWPNGTWWTGWIEGAERSVLLVPAGDYEAVFAAIVARGLQGNFLIEGAPVSDVREAIESSLWKKAASDRNSGDNQAVADALDNYNSLLGTLS